MRALGSALLLLVAFSVSAQNYLGRVLLPIYLEEPVSGAFGSRWVSEFAVRNNSSVGSVLIEPCSLPPDGACLAVLNADENLNPGETQTALPVRYLDHHPGGPGKILYFPAISEPAGRPNDLSFHLRIFDSSRAGLNAGTTLPVIREQELLTATTRLVGVPVDPRFRTTLRVYELDQLESDFAIRVYDQKTGALLSEQRVHLAVRSPELEPRFEPAYVEIGNLPLPLSGPVQVEVQPLTGGVKFWTFLSITNDETQHVTLVTPE